MQPELAFRLGLSEGRQRPDRGVPAGCLGATSARLHCQRHSQKQPACTNIPAPSPPVCPCRLEALETTSRDCEQLMPQAQAALAGRARQLAVELAGVESDISEAEAKHELYKLLEIRTRWVW